MWDVLKIGGWILLIFAVTALVTWLVIAGATPPHVPN